MLSNDELKRYKRQLIMPDIGEKGQRLLKSAKVLVIGAGGLGSPVLYYLTAVGVGTLGILDYDKVELSNLQRQILHNTNDINKEKVHSAKETLEVLNPNVKLNIYPLKINKTNAKEIIEQYNIIVTALDNFKTRHLVNEIAVKLNKPLVEAGVAGWDGVITTIIPYETACYRCIFPEFPREKTDTEIGLIGCLPGVLGTMQAMEVVKLILGIGKNLKNRLLVFDGLEMKFNEFSIQKNPNCPVCGKKDKAEVEEGL
jgi:molybdopterin/thiamine biosynthesis adenylyltransferase